MLSSHDYLLSSFAVNSLAPHADVFALRRFERPLARLALHCTLAFLRKGSSWNRGFIVLTSLTHTSLAIRRRRGISHSSMIRGGPPSFRGKQRSRREGGVVHSCSRFPCFLVDACCAPFLLESRWRDREEGRGREGGDASSSPFCLPPGIAFEPSRVSGSSQRRYICSRHSRAVLI